MIRFVVFVVIAPMILHSVYLDVRYSRFISLSSDILTSELGNQYQSVCTLSEERAGAFQFKVFLLNGNCFLGQMSLSHEESIAVDTSPLWGTARLLLVNDQGQTQYDGISDTAAQIQLSPGLYHVYLVGSWFTGSIEISYDRALFTSN